MLIVFKTRWSELTLASAPASAAGHLLIRDCSHSALYPSTIPRNWKSPPSASAAFAVSSGLLIFFFKYLGRAFKMWRARMASSK